MVDATDSRPGLNPDRASFTIALNTARDQVIHAAGVIADTIIDLVGAIGTHVLAALLPERRRQQGPAAAGDQRGEPHHRIAGAAVVPSALAVDGQVGRGIRAADRAASIAASTLPRHRTSRVAGPAAGPRSRSNSVRRGAAPTRRRAAASAAGDGWATGSPCRPAVSRAQTCR